MYALDEDGWALDTRRLPSSHFNHRPQGMVADLIVLHYISLPPGEFGGSTVERFFLGTLDVAEDPRLANLSGIDVSSHFFIGRSGALDQFVSTKERAWHAGVSSFLGRENCNDFSVGIELEGTANIAFTDAQYATLTELLESLYNAGGFSTITGHSDIAPGRKIDPGPFFDWPRLARALQNGACPLRIWHAGTWL